METSMILIVMMMMIIVFMMLVQQVRYMKGPRFLSRCNKNHR